MPNYIYIGELTKELTPGSTYQLLFADFTGKIFESHHDLEGKPDERICAYSQYKGSFYKVYENAIEVLKDWKIELNINSTTARINEELKRRFKKS